MITRTVAGFRDGSFTSEPAPDWLIAACERAEKDNRSWDAVLTDAIGSKPWITKVEDDTSFSGEVIDRLTRDPAHLDSIVDVAGYAACLRKVTRA